jgi:hypothetical protein
VQVELDVYRTRENRAQGDYEDASPLAWEEHRMFGSTWADVSVEDFAG